ncbi:hypothetical protein ACWGIB_22220 [Streptomyces xiamenensis]
MSPVLPDSQVNHPAESTTDPTSEARNPLFDQAPRLFAVVTQDDEDENADRVLAWGLTPAAGGVVVCHNDDEATPLRLQSVERVEWWFGIGGRAVWVEWADRAA